MIRKHALTLFLLAVALLDGTRWEMRPKGIAGTLLFWKSDTLTFDAGMFRSAHEGRAGFPQAAYEAGEDNGKGVWTATQTNEKGDRIDWKGSWKGDRMKGTLTWTWKDGRQKKVRWKARKAD